MASSEGRCRQHGLVPPAALISRETNSEKMEQPTVKYGHAAQSKKGEDYFLSKTDYLRVPGNSSSTFSVDALSNKGGRLIIASDGIRDALSSEMPAKSSCGLPAELAAGQVVKEALRARGLKDDTTCIVVDIIPPDDELPLPSPKKQNKLRALLFRKRSHSSVSKRAKKLSAIDIFEELFEEGSTMLAERLGNDENSGPSTTSGLFVCAVCQGDLGSNEGISVHAGSIFSTGSKPWQGPFLCSDCHDKKDAMEGKCSSRVKVS